jgi:hypothetical protein
MQKPWPMVGQLQFVFKVAFVDKTQKAPTPSSEHCPLVVH